MRRRSAIITGIILLLGFSVLFSTCGYERIDAGHVGVEVDLYGSNKGIQDVTRVTGAVWYNKWKTQIYEFPTYIQHKEYRRNESFVVNSRDGSEFHVSPIINYYVQADKVVSIFRKYRKTLPEIESGFIKTAVYDAFRIATNSYTADSLISHRETYEKLVRKYIEQQLKGEGFIIQQFTSNLSYPPSFKLAIEAKNAAVQKALEVENQVRQAEARAKIKIADAEGTAQSLIMQAKAEAQANELRQRSLNSLIIEQLWIEKWNGQVPVYGNMPMLFKEIK